MNKTLKTMPILLPNDTIDKSKWAVVSCDQFTSQRSYWKQLSDFVADGHSTLDLIFPEVYLEDSDHDMRIEKIKQKMHEALSGGLFTELQDSFILVERDTKYGKKRLGILASVDLEDFVYDGSCESAIRSTEGVVPNRIPPRLKIRSGAPIELPHILLLIDDRERTIIESFYEKREQLTKLYDFKLNMDGGHLKGYAVNSQEVIDSFRRLEDKDLQIEKYGKVTNFLFAVGDGNHSLATAKAHWEKIKPTLSETEKENHPARFALCEIENLHDDGIVFEPIHRCVFGAKEDLIVELSQKLKGTGKLEIEYDNVITILAMPESSPEAIATIEEVVTEYVENNPGTSVDYIHGENHLLSVARESGAVAIKMPALCKSDLFQYVLEHGALCKKSFSMGEAEEKRYYFEAKRI